MTGYRYDDRGDVAEITWPVGGSRVFAWNDDHQATEIRDADGRVVRVRDERGDEHFEWNPLDQLVGIGHPDGSVTRYAYDGFGRRVSKRSGDVVSEYFWSGDDLMCERSGASVTGYLITESEAHAVWQDGRCLHVVSTGLDAPRPQEILSDDGALAWHGTFDDWGCLLREHGTYASQRLRLPGQLADDESGLSYNRHCYYDPAAGQFVRPASLSRELQHLPLRPEPHQLGRPAGPRLREGEGQVQRVRARGQREAPTDPLRRHHRAAPRRPCQQLARNLFSARPRGEQSADQPEAALAQHETARDERRLPRLSQPPRRQPHDDQRFDGQQPPGPQLRHVLTRHELAPRSPAGARPQSPWLDLSPNAPKPSPPSGSPET